ncbi:hypothetical protein EJB05_26807, partial [Eragrostis curvula]
MIAGRKALSVANKSARPEKRTRKSTQAESSSRPQKRMRKPAGAAESNTQGEMPSQSSVRSTLVKTKKVAANKKKNSTT